MSPKVDGVQQIMPDHVDGFFERVENKTMRIESVLAKAVEHGSALVICYVLSAKYPAGAAGVVSVFNHRHGESAPGQQCPGRQTGESAADHNDSFFHDRLPVIHCLLQTIIACDKLSREPSTAITMRDAKQKKNRRSMFASVSVATVRGCLPAFVWQCLLRDN